MSEIGVAPAAPRDDRGVPAARRPTFDEIYGEFFEFAWRSSRRTWLFGITLRVVRDHRRTYQRKEAPLAGSVPEDLDALLAPGRSPDDAAQVAEATRVLHVLLDALDDEKRAIFVMADLEELPVPEIAEALGVNVNTAYSRLRVARREFEQALARYRARTDRSEP